MIYGVGQTLVTVKNFDQKYTAILVQGLRDPDRQRYANK
jgi:hypothetical protein